MLLYCPAFIITINNIFTFLIIKIVNKTIVFEPACPTFMLGSYVSLSVGLFLVKNYWTIIPIPKNIASRVYEMRSWTWMKVKVTSLEDVILKTNLQSYWY